MHHRAAAGVRTTVRGRGPMRILTINAGSSSLKVALYEWRAPSEGDATDAAAAAAASLDAAVPGTANGPVLLTSQNLHPKQDPVKSLQYYVDHATTHGSSSPSTPPPPIRLVVHRIVHGGPLFHAPTLLTPEVLKQLETLNHFAPLHNPPALQWIDAARNAFPDVSRPSEKSGATALPAVQHVGVFDTAFFHDLPMVSQQYALPRELVEKHQIRRYGFHGIAHEAMLHTIKQHCRLKEKQGGRLITMQLGSGASAAAILNGAPQDTSMGFTPLEGLVMSTRSGDVDPALLLYLEREEATLRSSKAMEDMLYHQCGLLGLSGETGDMKLLVDAASSPNGAHATGARLAVDVFVHRLIKYVGAYIALLGGVDTLVFGGGIGEHDARVRESLIDRLGEFLPVQLDRSANVNVGSDAATRISTAASKIEVWVVAVDEGGIMVRDALQLTHPQGFKSQL